MTKKTASTTCKLCNQSIIATDNVQLGVLAMAHIFQKHPTELEYKDIAKHLAELLEKDFDISELMFYE